MSSLPTPWSKNIALARYGTKANAPALNGGKLETVASVNPKNKERIFALSFPEVTPVRKIVIHNENLFRFDVEYWDIKAAGWETIDSIRQRRDIGNKRAQPKYIFDRINVSRIADDDAVPKPIPGPNDKILDRVTQTEGGWYYPHFRVVTPSQAKVREIEVYHLQSSE